MENVYLLRCHVTRIREARQAVSSEKRKNSASRSVGKDHPSAVRDVCPLADHRAPDGGAAHAAASGDEGDSTCGMTTKEDKKTPARVGRVPGLILAQLWGRPSLAGCVLLLAV